eukprot:TRINITY_DN1358_c0_g2_i1.p1 TRINITY_DN1358_c0_g2~~TRINITY_DN1358_c0_g2_i1.p1  ORF type:complete len:156 (-),score=20.56 TRINITY_DN1358_c0_g2_i1:872-1339(-)
MPIALTNEELQETLDLLNKDRWYANDRVPARVRPWYQTLKLKFMCDSCQHSWSTMKGMISFKIWRDGGDKNIFCELYRQQCKRCNEFCDPEVYTEEFDSIVDSVTHKFERPRERSKDIRKKAGNPRKSHDSKRCEACYSGKCSLANRGDEDEGEE